MSPGCTPCTQQLPCLTSEYPLPATGCEASIKEAEAAASSATTKHFSMVQLSEVQAILGKLGLGFAAGQAVMPQGTGAAGSSTHSNACHDFDISACPSADYATAALVTHHQEQLAKLGVPFGPGGFKVYDMHGCKSPLLSFSFQSVLYKGSFSCGVAPIRLVMPASSWVCRVIYAHKASKVCPELWRLFASDGSAHVRAWPLRTLLLTCWLASEGSS